MVIIKKPFDMVFELWCQDMGLGPDGLQYDAVRRKMEDDDVSVNGE